GRAPGRKRHEEREGQKPERGEGGGGGGGGGGGRTMGRAGAGPAAPISAPISEEASAAPSARPASPFFAIAWPSRMMAAVVASPGTPKRIDVTSPVVATTECMPSRKAKASTGCMLSMKGSISASVVAPPRPGRRPTQKPTTMPSSMKANAFHCRTRNSPWSSASSTAKCSFAEFDVLGELGDDVLGLRQDLPQDFLRVLARGVLEILLRLLRFRLRRRVGDGGGERVAHRLDDIGRGAGRQHVGARDLLRRRAQRHDG